MTCFSANAQLTANVFSTVISWPPPRTQGDTSEARESPDESTRRQYGQLSADDDDIDAARACCYRRSPSGFAAGSRGTACASSKSDGSQGCVRDDSALRQRGSSCLQETRLQQWHASRCWSQPPSSLPSWPPAATHIPPQRSRIITLHSPENRAHTQQSSATAGAAYPLAARLART